MPGRFPIVCSRLLPAVGLVALGLATALLAQPPDEKRMEAWWADLEKGETEATRAVLNLSARPAEAVAFLRKQGVAQRTVAQVRSLILATRMDVEPRNLMQKVLRDADSAKAGQVDFEERSERLRKELGTVRKRELGDDEWLKENLAYLRTHRFYTAHARRIEERFQSSRFCVESTAPPQRGTADLNAMPPSRQSRAGPNRSARARRPRLPLRQ